jgi:hypothetical protein
MKKLPTGEPYAGKPPVRFGGRGGRQPFPTPIDSMRARVTAYTRATVFLAARRPAKPAPAKPSSIIAQVEASGTAV